MKNHVFRNLWVIACMTISLTTWSQSVLICGAPSTSSWNNDVEAKLEATGQFTVVDVINTTQNTPTVSELLNYDAVLVYTDAGPINGQTFGDNLASYIDQGGAVVNCVFSMASVSVGGAFSNNVNYAVANFVGTQNQPGNMQLGTVISPTHPILQGVTSFNGGTSSFYSPGNSFAPGAVVQAYYNNNEWFVATRENVGAMGVRRVDLNFYPPSSDARSDFWVSSTQGGLLMANALTWAMNGTIANISGCMNAAACNYNVAATVDDGSCTFSSLYYPDADADGYGDSQTGLPGNYTMQSVPFTMESPVAGTNQGPICDDCTQNIPIGFNFSFYGVTYSGLTISSNGFVTFDNNMNSGCCSGGVIPNFLCN